MDLEVMDMCIKFAAMCLAPFERNHNDNDKKARSI